MSHWKGERGRLILEARHETGPQAGEYISFEGTLFGAYPPEGHAWGEAVFNTSLTGYQEILTDPSYHRQLVCMTASHIGNTGINREDEESPSPRVAGLVLRADPGTHSNWRSEESLDSYLERHSIPGIHGVDTRALTRILRARGTPRALLLRESDIHRTPALFRTTPAVGDMDLILEVTTRSQYRVPALGAKRHRIAALDFGVKRTLLQELAAQGCEIQVYPAETSSAVILATKPDGLFLSNGPGDPKLATYAVKTVQELLGKLPIFGVCMGHQVLGLALGGETYKLKFGHRGGNQPVKDVKSGRLEISSHNHGYAVRPESLKGRAQATHINLNDGCLEGLASCPAPGEAPAFSVQYHPEAAPGPHDSKGLFSEFVRQMERWKIPG